MKLNTKDWHEFNLDNDELEMLESIENQQWKSIGNIEFRKNQLREFFSNDEETINQINLTLDKSDFQKILDKSNQYGISYKELLEKLVHNFAIGKIAL